MATSQYTNNRWMGTWAGYDAAGNQTALASRTYTYDAENRLVASTQPNMPAIGYSYDGEGRRVAKNVGSVNTTYVYDAQGQMAAEYGPTTDSGTSYLTADHLGSTRVVRDGSGAVKKCYDYYPFGEDIAAGTGGRSGCFASGVYPDNPDLLADKSNIKRACAIHISCSLSPTRENMFECWEADLFRALVGFRPRHAIDPPAVPALAVSMDRPHRRLLHQVAPKF